MAAHEALVLSCLSTQVSVLREIFPARDNATFCFQYIARGRLAALKAVMK